jgi:hypothetical protein
VKRALANLILFATTSLSAAPIALAPSEIAPDTFSHAGRYSVSAASNGKQFFVAWENRLFPTFAETGYVEFRTYDADGNPQQTLPQSSTRGNGPSVTWDGANWFVIAPNPISRFNSFDNMPAIIGTPVDEQGRAVVPITIATAVHSSSRATSIFDGSRYLVSDGNLALIAARGGDPIIRLPEAYWPLAAANGLFLAAKHDTSALVILDSSGTVQSTIEVSRVIAATADGDKFVVLAARDTFVDRVFIARDGRIVSREAIAVSAHPSFGAVVRSGDSYLGAWPDGNKLTVVRFDQTTASAPQMTYTRPQPVESVSLAVSNQKTLVAWSENGGTGVIYTAFVPSSGVPDLSVATVASTIVQPQRNPSLVVDGAGYTVAWNEPASNPRAMLGGLDANGAPRPVEVFAAPAQSKVELARFAGRTLAVWSTGGADPQVYAQLVGGTPQLLGIGDQAKVATNGSNALVVWRQAGKIVSSIVTAAGEVLSPNGMQLAPVSLDQSLPAVASRGSDYLVAWAHVQNYNDLTAIGVSNEGFPSGGVMTLAATRDAITAIDMAASGRLYLITVANRAGDIGLGVTSIVQDILVNGVEEGVLRVRGRQGGGFSILHGGAPLRVANIDGFGNVASDSALPISASSADFVLDGGRMVLAYSNDTQVYVEMFGPRVRVTR